MHTGRPLSEGNRLQRAYHRWAAPHYARMAPDLREQSELIDRFLYSRRGLGFWAGLLSAAIGSAWGLRQAGLPMSLAVALSVVAWCALPMMLLVAWLQPTLFSVTWLRRKLPAIVAMAVCGGLAGFVVGHVARHGRLDADLIARQAGDAMLVLGPAILLATVSLLALIWGVAQVRRQVLEREVLQLRLQRERDSAARQAAEARLQLLQGQIQPHFIFNTLSAVQHWVDEGDARGGPLLRSLTAFLRGSTEALGRDTTTLADEAAMVGHYLSIMQARLGERLACTIEVAPEVAQQRLPPGLLLTLVENAVEHGIAAALGGGRLTLMARRLGEACIVTVSDTTGRLSADWAEGVGLANSRERLRQTFGEDAALTLALAEGSTVATLSLPRQLAASPAAGAPASHPPAPTFHAASTPP
jgi:Histidine kinase